MATEGAVKLATELCDFGGDPEFVAADADLIDSALKELVEAAWDAADVMDYDCEEGASSRLRAALQPWSPRRKPCSSLGRTASPELTGPQLGRKDHANGVAV